jgi:hypothetical protein
MFHSTCRHNAHSIIAYSGRWPFAKQKSSKTTAQSMKLLVKHMSVSALNLKIAVVK